MYARAAAWGAVPALRRLVAACFCGGLVLAACQPAASAPLPTLAVLPTALPELILWESAEGQWQAGQAALEWRFLAQAGDPLRLNVLAEGSEAELRLFDPQGQLIGQGNPLEFSAASFGEYRVQLTLTQAGRYSLGLGRSDQEPPGRIRPTVVVGVPTPTPLPSQRLGAYIGPLVAGQPLTGSLSAEQPIHVYSLDVPGGAVVNLSLKRLSGTLDPSLAFYDPELNLLAQDEFSADGRSARLLNLLVPQGGLYSLVVSGDDFFGDYEVRWVDGPLTVRPDATPSATPQPIPLYLTPTLGVASETRLSDHLPVLGNLAREGDFARFSFVGRVGESLSVGVAALDGARWSPQFEVYDPDGALLLSARASQSLDSGVAQALSVPLALDGPYLFLVTAEGGGSGAFQISAGRGPSYRERYIGRAEANQRTEGQLEGLGLRHSYGLRLNAGDIITVAVSAAEEGQAALDPYVELVRPALDGAPEVLIAGDDNGGGGTTALIRLAPIEQAGDYLIRVRAARGDQRGGYSLLWRYVNLAPTATPIPQSVTLLALDDRIDADEYRFYAFQGRAGQRVRVQVAALPGESFDPLAVLLDPQGREIAQGDDSPDSLNVDFIATLPADGTYQLRVNGYLSGGAYVAQVAALLE